MNRWPAWILLALLATPARAQVAEPSWNQSHDPYVAALGLAAGLTSGSGLAIRWPAFPQTMMSVAGGVWGGGDDLAWNVGLQADFVLRQVGRTRLLAGPAAGFYSDDEDGETNVNLSLGLGWEYLLRSRLAMKVDLGFTYITDGKKVYPLPQLAFYYYF